MRNLEEWHPAVLFVYFAAVMGIAMLNMYPPLMISCMIGGGIYFTVRSGKIKPHGKYFLLWVILAIINPLTVHHGKTVLFILNDNPVTLEAVIYGIISAVRIIGVLYWLKILSDVMTSEKVIYLFGKISPKVALFVSMTLRFVPLFQRQWKKIYDTQKAMGYFQSDNAIDFFRERMRILDILITWGLENGMITADSMEARGAGTGKRTNFSLYQMHTEDKMILLMIIFLTGIIFIAQWKGMGMNVYPEIIIQGETFWNKAGGIAYAILAIFPVIWEFEVKLKWKYLQSKI